jgi:O-antigen ligase
VSSSVTSGARAHGLQAVVGPTDDRKAAVAGAVALSVVVLGLAGGGVTSGSWPWLIAGFALLATSLLMLDVVRSNLRSALIFVGGLLALSLWTGLSAVWSIDPHASLRELERDMLYLAAFFAGFGLVRVGGQAAVVGGMALGATAVAGYSLVELATRDRAAIDSSVPSAPIGYANALAVLCLLGAIAAVSLAASARSLRSRVSWLALLAILCPTIVLTKSVGSMLVAVVVVAAAAMLRIVSAPVRRARTPVLVAGGLVVCVLIAVGAFFAGSHLTRNDRAAYWRVAARDLRSHVLAGSGGGTYASYWSRHPEPARLIPLEAHSLYLETGAELGAVGLAVLLTTIALPLRAVLRRDTILEVGRDPILLGATCAYVAFVVHAAADWDWEIPVVCVSGLYFAAVLLGHTHDARRDDVLAGTG